MQGFIYKITSPTGKIYIGQTVELEERKTKYRLGHCKSQRKIYNSIKKHGWEAHTFDVIDQTNYCGVDNFLLDLYEIYWIKEYKSNFSRFPNGIGMNLTDGGEGNKGHKHTEEYKQRMSIIQKEISKTVSQDHWVISEACRAASIKASTGRIPTEEHKAKRLETIRKNAAERGYWYKPGSQESARKKRCKPVLQYDLDGNFIKEWESLADIGRYFGVHSANISPVCLGKTTSFRGFKFKYK